MKRFLLVLGLGAFLFLGCGHDERVDVKAPPGPRGPNGNPGNPGEKGEKGDPGPKGDQGPVGDKGPAGDQGGGGNGGGGNPGGGNGGSGNPGSGCQIVNQGNNVIITCGGQSVTINRFGGASDLLICYCNNGQQETLLAKIEDINARKYNILHVGQCY